MVPNPKSKIFANEYNIFGEKHLFQVVKAIVDLNVWVQQEMIFWVVGLGHFVLVGEAIYISN